MTDQPAGGSLAERAARLDGALNRALIAFHDLNMAKGELHDMENQEQEFLRATPPVFSSSAAYLLHAETRDRWKELVANVRDKSGLARDRYVKSLEVLRDLLPRGVCVEISGYNVMLHEGMSGLDMSVSLAKKEAKE